MKTVIYNNLEWAVEGLDKKMNWEKANNYCKSLGKGWRLPTLKELVNIIDHTKCDPALPDSMLFPSVVSSWYWSSTTFVLFTGDAWVMGLDYGYVNDVSKTLTNYVWPVRDIKCKEITK